MSQPSPSPQLPTGALSRLPLPAALALAQVLGRGHSPDFLDVGEVRDGVLAFASDAAALQFADALELESFAQVRAPVLWPLLDLPQGGRPAAACCQPRGSWSAC
jgi:hypothetical protein